MVFTPRRFGHIYDVVLASVHYTIKSDSNHLRSGSGGVVKTFRWQNEIHGIRSRRP